MISFRILSYLWSIDDVSVIILRSAASFAAFSRFFSFLLFHNLLLLIIRIRSSSLYSSFCSYSGFERSARKSEKKSQIPTFLASWSYLLIIAACSCSQALSVSGSSRYIVFTMRRISAGVLFLLLFSSLIYSVKRPRPVTFL